MGYHQGVRKLKDFMFLFFHSSWYSTEDKAKFIWRKRKFPTEISHEGEMHYLSEWDASNYNSSPRLMLRYGPYRMCLSPVNEETVRVEVEEFYDGNWCNVHDIDWVGEEKLRLGSAAVGMTDVRILESSSKLMNE